ncbi:sugar transferase [Pseudanabaena sp. FACHB-2040]|uniref:sugar transferase n=1 Tax=Pseudanabaena sp. FACHB-2040 TaxID=2692859 RepID=UPI0016849098|nr:sugar transferase [Pseudanabaena sp. FACHB-2040]MBD2257482.1 sugar transferase [Pseudanabaena sp. FACHB-2040]
MTPAESLTSAETLETASLPLADKQEEAVLSLPSALTLVEAVEFEKTVQGFYQATPNLKSLVLDFSQTTFIDSSGLGALVICYRHSKAHSSQLILRGVQAQVRMALEMTDLDQLFTFEASTSAPEPAVQATVLASPPSTHPSVNSFGKRLIDVVGALVGLVITAVLLVPIAIAIKLEDGGPIFFSQVRCSWLGKRFKIHKFRSMVTDAEALKHKVQNQVEGPLFKNESDFRITRVGRFLRKTSLDELPQFWNVLKGEMSLVGTRPPTPDEIEQYKVPEWQRLNVKPGMTGEWQVNGRSQVKSFEDVIRMDLAYQKNWNLLYDLQLILKTVLVVFSKRSGAA